MPFFIDRGKAEVIVEKESEFGLNLEPYGYFDQMHTTDI